MNGGSLMAGPPPTISDRSPLIGRGIRTWV